ncbi:MAG TPA: DUF2934 domain-containing protein [Terriglobales bacterium]|jgi:topoisomerase IA-like protein|nr:DUF2934 domain-containing protein [Terriglobales bacterium]
MGRDEEIRLIAYKLWESENRPEGREAEHWARAEALWQEQNAKPSTKAKPNSKRATARKTTAAKSTARKTRPKKTDPSSPGS